ncbi:MAG: zinc-binding dehydrogenase [Chloroherpetonaceae bacterium]
MSNKMKAAVLNELGKPLEIQEVDIPEIMDNDVLVKVTAVHIAPSTKGLLNAGGDFIRPNLPAIFGSDVVGTVTKVGKAVKGINEGQRVYVNSLISNGTDEFSLKGKNQLSDSMAFVGMFTFNPNGTKLLNEYRGGFAEYMKIPYTNIVPLDSSITDEQAVRLGYLGTAYQALKYAKVNQHSTVLINGATGTLGVSAVHMALAMGASKIIAVANRKDRLDKLASINPKKIIPISLQDDDYMQKILGATEGKGADALIDCLQYVGAGSTNQLLFAMKKAGTAVFIGGATGNVSVPYGFLLGTEVNITGSIWFSTADGIEMVNLVKNGHLDLSKLENKVYNFDKINEAIDYADARNGGIYNIVVKM